MDLDQSKVIYATEGKDAHTVGSFKQDFEKHQGDSEKIVNVCCYMPPAFIKEAEENLYKAAITFDKFHVMKKINEAVDKVRRVE